MSGEFCEDCWVDQRICKGAKKKTEEYIVIFNLFCVNILFQMKYIKWNVFFLLACLYFVGTIESDNRQMNFFYMASAGFRRQTRIKAESK